MNLLEQTFWATRVNALAAYKAWKADTTNHLLMRTYQNAWEDYARADKQFFLWEAKQ